MPSLVLQRAMVDVMAYPVFMYEGAKMMKGDKSTLDCLSDRESNYGFFKQYAMEMLKSVQSKGTSGFWRGRRRAHPKTRLTVARRAHQRAQEKQLIQRRLRRHLWGS